MRRVVVAGPRGRLGRVAVEAVGDDEGCVLAGTIDRDDDARATLAGARADVLVDATLASASRDLALAALGLGVRPVIGVSGLSDDDVAAIADAARGSGALLVPNFSLGAVLAMRAAEWFASWMPCTSIVERHHPAKRDRPSGTALATARRVAAARADGTLPPITSERLDGVLAEQRTVFAGPHETLSVEHVVSDRAAFAPGIQLAVHAVAEVEGLVVGLDALVGAP